MAGDWIKWQKGLHRKPEVLRMSAVLSISPLETAGMCMAVWEWIDEVSVDGVVDVPVDATVDAVSSLCGNKMFAQCMSDVGWLDITGEKLVVPNFDRHNGDSAKNRVQKTDRQRKWRASTTPIVDADVVAVVDAKSTTRASTREEKRREDKKQNKQKGDKLPPRPKFIKPTTEEVAAYCKEREKGVDPQKWFDHYTANGWKVGKNAMKDWRAAVRTWEGGSNFGNVEPMNTDPNRWIPKD